MSDASGMQIVWDCEVEIRKWAIEQAIRADYRHSMDIVDAARDITNFVMDTEKETPLQKIIEAARELEGEPISEKEKS